MALLLKGYNFMFEEIADPRVKSYFLMGSPFPLFFLLCFYVYFVRKLGPQLMKNRKPFKLEKVIILYNVLQICACTFLVVQALKHTVFKYNIFCEPVDYSLDEHPVYITKCVWWYFMLKVIDMIDTLFFVLRKKDQHLSFLHVYHHAGMALLSWCAAKYLPGGHSVFIGFINSIVHMVMYFYYLLTVWDAKYKNNIWWKKHITQLQIAQFVLLGLYVLQIWFQPNCKYPRWLVWILMPQDIFIITLFTNFYIKTYVNNPATKPKTESRNSGVENRDSETQKIKSQKHLFVCGPQSYLT